uniref:ASD2 domain-containing protein n=1 Tax=Romanomermis culicivorax TaxID=13658 RepID=A0A915KS88_ROMCU
MTRRNASTAPKFRDQPKLNAALNDDHSTIRRSRLVAEKSNDSDLYDLLLNQQRRSVDYFGAVLSSSAMIDNHPSEINSNKNIRLDDIDEAKISTFCDYSNNNQTKNFDSTNAKINRNDDHRRLSIGSDKSVNLDDEKKELIVSLTNKLDVLRDALADVEDEAVYNEQLGSKIADIVRNSEYLSQNDKDLYRLHVQDVEKITHLLLKLSCQLARIDNDLNGVQASCSVMDKDKLLERKNRLTEQLQDAASLKQDIDERGRRLAKILEKCPNGLNGGSQNENEADDVVDDYLYFMQMKTQLLLDATEIRDKIKLGETQRQALIDSLG